MEVIRMTIVKRARMAATAMIVAGLLTALGSSAALGAEPGFGKLWLNGEIVGTVVPPAQVAAGSGRDPFYKVTNGVGAAQLGGVAGVGPGEPGYHGGDWQVWTVSFKSGVTPYLLRSASDVAAAAAKGHVSVIRDGAHDFRCPITSTAVG
jgi:hypothetical protein